LAVTVGIIGAGQIARFHAEEVIAADGCLVAIADPDEGRGRRLATRMGAAYLATAEALLDDPRVQAIIIATPNATHYRLALAAIQNGKDVLCEKPLTTDAEDSARLVQAVRDRPGVIFQVGYMKRFNPGFELLREVLPQVGDLLHAEVRVLAERRPEPIATWYRQPQQSGGGILTHSGSHLIDVMRFLFGEPARVDARVRYAPETPSLDQASQTLIDLESGLAVHLSAVSTPVPLLGHTGEGWEECVEAIGSKGRVRLSSPKWQGTAPCLITLQLSGERQARILRAEDGSQWEAEMRAFLEAVATRRPASPDVVDGCRVDEILAAIYASGARGAPVDLCWRC
jgi:myo-inositol 2-dehydrogenase/D-chiro-inositol 1-dehydrogenase